MLLKLSLQNETRLPVYFQGSLCILRQITLEVEDTVEVEEAIESFLRDVHSESAICQDVIEACNANVKKPTFSDEADFFTISWETVQEIKTVVVKVNNPENLPLTHNEIQVGELNLSYKVTSNAEAAQVVGKVMNQFDSSDADIEKWLETLYQGEESFAAQDPSHRYSYGGKMHLEWYVN